MRTPAPAWIAAAALLACAALLAATLLLRRPHPLPLTQRVAPTMAGEPRLMLWAWETPQDLRTLDPTRAGVAFLAGELHLGTTAQPAPRRQPLLLAPGTWLLAVVRLQPTPRFSDTPTLRSATAAGILQLAARPGVRALQVDFDATLSQRPFYAAVLQQLHATVPLPLSITALASWCGPGSWLAHLPAPTPIAEAVPMLFRLGGPAALSRTLPRTQPARPTPLCAGSVGLSTDEPWPPIGPHQRVYLFRPGPWTPNQLAQINHGQFAHLGYAVPAATPSPGAHP